MDDSIIAVIAAIAIGIFQLVTSVNKKRKAQEQRMRSQSDAYEADTDWEEAEEAEEAEPTAPLFTVLSEQAVRALEPVSLSQVRKPQKERGFKAIPYTAPEAEAAAESEDEEESLLSDFTLRNAVLFSEVMNSKWNT